MTGSEGDNLDFKGKRGDKEDGAASASVKAKAAEPVAKGVNKTKVPENVEAEETEKVADSSPTYPSTLTMCLFDSSTGHSTRLRKSTESLR